MNKMIKRLVPSFIKRYLVRQIFKWLENYWNSVSSKIPVFELQEKHIQNSKFLLSRLDLLENLPKNGIVAEIGVNMGEFSSQILDKCNPKKLHLIDAWASDRYNKKIENYVYDKFKTDKRVEINKGFSTSVHNSFEDGYFDWVYIDTDHSYEVTIRELELYSSKVKPDGIIAGHDYIIGNWDKMVRYGVIEAVYEFCSKNNWQIIYLTAQIGENPSFAIKKID